VSLISLLNTNVMPSIKRSVYFAILSEIVIKWLRKIELKMVLMISLEGVYIVKQEKPLYSLKSMLKEPDF
jgi:hypothetical protein